MKYYFYCPNCGYQEKTNSLPTYEMLDVVYSDYFAANIFRRKCPDCGNLKAGYMEVNNDSMDEVVKLREIISLHQGSKKDE